MIVALEIDGAELSADDLEGLIGLTLLLKTKRRRLLEIENIPKPSKIVRTNLRVPFFAGNKAREELRFLYKDLPVFMDCLEIPEKFTLENGCSINGEEACLLLLYRYAFPVRLTTMEVMWGREYTQISRVFNHVVRFVWATHGWLLHDRWDFFYTPEKCARYNGAIMATIEPAHRTPEIEDVADFLDATERESCTPTGNRNLQRIVYSGKKKLHGFKCQGKFLPDGMITHMKHCYPVSRNDGWVLRKSRVHARMLVHQTGWHRQYKTYTDRGYVELQLLHAAYKRVAGQAALPAWQALENEVMKVPRLCAEWGFGAIISKFAYMNFWAMHKIQLSCVGKYYLVAALLANMHNCLYGSLTSIHYDLIPPRLGEYFGRPDILV